MVIVDWYEPASPLITNVTEVQGAGLCGIGRDRCYDLVAIDGKESEEDGGRLFRVLGAGDPDYNEDLAEFSRTLNQEFVARARRALEDFIAKNKPKRPVHLAAIGTSHGLHLAFATRMEPGELAKKGATLAKAKLGRMYEQIMEKTQSGSAAPSKPKVAAKSR